MVAYLLRLLLFQNLQSTRYAAFFQPVQTPDSVITPPGRKPMDPRDREIEKLKRANVKLERRAQVAEQPGLFGIGCCRRRCPKAVYLAPATPLRTTGRFQKQAEKRKMPGNNPIKGRFHASRG